MNTSYNQANNHHDDDNNQNDNQSTMRGAPPPPLAEQGAIFRSVSMMSVPPPSLFSRPTTSLGNGSGGGAFLKSHSAPMESKSPPPKARTVPTIQLVPSTAAKWEWKLDPVNLEGVPLYHPLERTALTIRDVDLDTITSRISHHCRHNNMQANFGPGSRVQVRTDDLVSFAIQLWRNQPESGGGVICEIQRRQGCCVTMQSIRHALANAILYGSTNATAATTTSAKSGPPKSSCAFLSQLVEHTQDQQASVPDDSKSCLANALDLTRRLLSSSRFDERRLGLESLCALTDPSKVRTGDTEQAAQVVLQDAQWQALLVPFLSSSLSSTEGDELQLLSLKIVAHALDAATPNCRPQVDASFWNAVWTCLWDTIKNCPNCPLQAAWSIRILARLHEQQQASMMSPPRDGHIYLSQAHEYGRQHFASLEQETSELLGHMGLLDTATTTTTSVH